MTKRESTGTYGGLSAQQRTAERRGRLLEAGLQLLGTEGWHAASVRAICKQAALNPRYFYESFSGLDELLVAVFDSIVTEAVEAVAAVVARPGTVQDTSAAIVTTFVTTMTADPRKARVAFVEAIGSEALMRRRIDTMQRFAELVAATLAQQGGGARPTARVAVGAHMLVGGLIEAIVARLEGRLDVTEDELIDGCVAQFLAAHQA